MKSIYIALGLWFFCNSANAQINDEAKAAIHWGWINNGPPDNACASDEIAPGITRGPRGPRTCFDLAIAASKNGNDALALRWIITTQCHNGSARQSLLNGGVETVKFLMNTYGGGYTNGPKPPPQTPQCTVTVSNKSDRDYEIFYVIFNSGQHVPCESLKHSGKIEKGTNWSIVFPQGKDVWVRFKTSNSDGCRSSDEKFQIFGTGTFSAKKNYVIN